MADLSQTKLNIGESLQPIPKYLSRPWRLLRSYDRKDFRPDLLAGLTLAVILLPQTIAFALIAELPPEYGIYTAIVAGIVGGLWGSSNQTYTGPTNAGSLLVLSVLITSFKPGTPEFLLAAGMLALMAGLFQLILGLARLGLLVNFVSHSVIVGFATGAGFLIALRQLPHLLGIPVEAESTASTIYELITNFPSLNPATAAIGIFTIAFIVVMRRINRHFPAAIISLIIAGIFVYFLNLNEFGVEVIGEIKGSLPPFTSLPLLDLDFIQRLSTGALAVAAISLVQTIAISRSFAAKTGQRLDSNQEFVGQGLANIAVGFFSGYPSSGSFSFSAVNFNAGAHTPIAAVLSSLFLLVAVFVTGPLAAYLPRAALAGVLIVVGFGMINRAEIARIWQGARGDALIMLVTFLGTLFTEIAFAVLFGILLSFALYLLRTSMPRVHQVVPDLVFNHFEYQPDKPNCPQLGVVDILGDLYFGAVNHVEETILDYLDKNPEQRFLLIRMHNVNLCDFSGIYMLENIVKAYRENGGDVFMVKVHYTVNKLMTSTGFCDMLGMSNFLDEDQAISSIFYRKLDPAVCIYECPFRVFRECQNLPKQLYPEHIPLVADEVGKATIHEVPAEILWQELRDRERSIHVVDVREPREYHRGHIPKAELVPLPKILSGEHQFALGGDQKLVLVCRTGRRSRRAAQQILNGQEDIRILKGGMLAWEAAGLLEAID